MKFCCIFIKNIRLWQNCLWLFPLEGFDLIKGEGGEDKQQNIVKKFRELKSKQCQFSSKIAVVLKILNSGDSFVSLIGGREKGRESHLQNSQRKPSWLNMAILVLTHVDLLELKLAIRVQLVALIRRTSTLRSKVRWLWTWHSCLLCLRTYWSVLNVVVKWTHMLTWKEKLVFLITLLWSADLLNVSGSIVLALQWRKDNPSK